VLVHTGEPEGHECVAPEPLLPLHSTQAPVVPEVIKQNGYAPVQSPSLEHGKHAFDWAGGDGQLPPPLIRVPRQAHGSTVTMLPQNCPDVRCVHVPTWSPGTMP
jgi:hypothetical protein